ncbi:MAG: presqualene diphosphate synthase HpnD [Beijerinckiaceae bacterium]|nr:presqualene diphosphate synthase HpnD [Beijerinckiaceae bacterium]
MQNAAGTSESEQKVRKSSFYTALRILPAAQREAMYEIYAFCRDVDDIADDGGPRDQRQADLQQWRSGIDALFDGRPSARTRSLQRPVEQFGLRREDFQAVIDGMEMDITGDIRAPDMATLDLYCDRVASAVGRLSVRVFGMGESDGIALAHHLGRALQLTNILRDIDEDAGIGRLYLPREALEQAGIMSSEPEEVVAHTAIGEACKPVIALARTHFAEADAIMNRSPRRQIRTPRLMYEAYHSILEGVVRRGFASPRERVRIGKLRMIALLLRHGLF